MKATTFVFESTLWKLINRLKIHFLLIFFLMNTNFLRAYGYKDPLILVLTFTLLNFSLHLLNNYFDFPEDNITQQSSVMGKNTNLWAGIAAAVVSLMMVLGRHYSLVAFFVLFILGLSYSLPLYRSFRIKNVLFLKNITGSLFWWYIPFILIVSEHTGHDFGTLFLDNLDTLIVFMPFEPLWDIKDVNGDKQVGVITIPVKYGIEATKLLVCACFLLILLMRIKEGNYLALLLFGPLFVFTAAIREKTPLYAFQLMLFFVPLYIFLRAYVL